MKVQVLAVTLLVFLLCPNAQGSFMDGLLDHLEHFGHVFEKDTKSMEGDLKTSAEKAADSLKKLEDHLKPLVQKTESNTRDLVSLTKLKEKLQEAKQDLQAFEQELEQTEGKVGSKLFNILGLKAILQQIEEELESEIRKEAVAFLEKLLAKVKELEPKFQKMAIEEQAKLQTLLEELEVLIPEIVAKVQSGETYTLKKLVKLQALIQKLTEEFGPEITAYFEELLADVNALISYELQKFTNKIQGYINKIQAEMDTMASEEEARIQAYLDKLKVLITKGMTDFKNVANGLTEDLTESQALMQQYSKQLGPEITAYFEKIEKALIYLISVFQPKPQ